MHIFRIQVKYGDTWSEIRGKKSSKPKMVTLSPYDHITQVTCFVVIAKIGKVVHSELESIPVRY